MLNTPHDFKNGADYSDEFYAQVHETFDNFDKSLIFLKVIGVIIVIGILSGIVFWQWENITNIFAPIKEFIGFHKKQILASLAILIVYIASRYLRERIK